MLKLGNYNTDYINSVYVPEGYSDFINCNAALLATPEGQNIVTVRERTAIKADLDMTLHSFPMLDSWATPIHSLRIVS